VSLEPKRIGAEIQLAGPGENAPVSADIDLGEEGGIPERLEYALAD
jgi:hypothetical protein